MIYGYKRPTSSFTLSGGNSPVFETDIRLDNSQPSEQTVISGVSDNSPTTTDHLDITVDWAAPQGVGVVALLNLSCPAGVLVEVKGRRLGDGSYARDLGGNSETRTVQIADGRVQAVIATTATETDYIGVRISIYNDANSVTWANEDTDLLIGEICVYATTNLCAKPARTRGRSNRSQKERASNGALHVYPRGDYRTESLSIMGTIGDAYKGELDGGVDFAKLQAMQDAYRYRAFVIPRGANDYGTGPDYDLIQQKAMFCLVLWGQITEEEGRMRASVPLELEEAI